MFGTSEFQVKRNKKKGRDWSKNPEKVLGEQTVVGLITKRDRNW